MKQLVIFAGVNGAGKSTLFREYSSLLGSSHRLNADEVLASGQALNEFEAMKVIQRSIYSCIEQGVDFHLETTLAGVGKTHLKYIQLAKSKGYRISLVYVTLLSSDLANQRIAHRVSLGGHYIKPEVVRRRFKSSLSNFYNLLPYVDYLEVYDNTSTMQGIFFGQPALFAGTQADSILKSRLK